MAHVLPQTRPDSVPGGGATPSVPTSASVPVQAPTPDHAATLAASQSVTLQNPANIKPPHVDPAADAGPPLSLTDHLDGVSRYSTASGMDVAKETGKNLVAGGLLIATAIASGPFAPLVLLGGAAFMGVRQIYRNKQFRNQRFNQLDPQKLTNAVNWMAAHGPQDKQSTLKNLASQYDHARSESDVDEQIRLLLQIQDLSEHKVDFHQCAKTYQDPSSASGYVKNTKRTPPNATNVPRANPNSFQGKHTGVFPGNLEQLHTKHAQELAKFEKCRNDLKAAEGKLAALSGTSTEEQLKQVGAVSAVEESERARDAALEKLTASLKEINEERVKLSETKHVPGSSEQLQFLAGLGASLEAEWRTLHIMNEGQPDENQLKIWHKNYKLIQKAYQEAKQAQANASRQATATGATSKQVAGGGAASAAPTNPGTNSPPKIEPVQQVQQVSGVRRTLVGGNDDNNNEMAQSSQAQPVTLSPRQLDQQEIEETLSQDGGGTTKSLMAVEMMPGNHNTKKDA